VWTRQVDELATTTTRWTGNDTRVVEYTVDDLRAAIAQPLVHDVLDHGLTVAGSRGLADKAATGSPERIAKLMMRRTKDCTDTIRIGRLEKANEFHEAAVLIEDDVPNASVDLLIDAGIAAADVICCARLGVHATGENHNEASLCSSRPRLAWRSTCGPC
jgi:hypothetical protein